MLNLVSKHPAKSVFFYILLAFADILHYRYSSLRIDQFKFKSRFVGNQLDKN